MVNSVLVMVIVNHYFVERKKVSQGPGLVLMIVMVIGQGHDEVYNWPVDMKWFSGSQKVPNPLLLSTSLVEAGPSWIIYADNRNIKSTKTNEGKGKIEGVKRQKKKRKRWQKSWTEKGDRK